MPSVVTDVIDSVVTDVIDARNQAQHDGQSFPLVLLILGSLKVVLEVFENERWSPVLKSWGST